VRLLDQHRLCEIKAALNINHSTLKRWKQDYSPRAAERSREESTAFISLPEVEPLSAASSAQSNATLKITRHAGDGSSVCVEGHLSLEQWRCALRVLAYGEIIE
jgi:hypothetical protein